MGIVHRINDSVAPTAMLEMLARLRPRDTFDEIVAHLEPPSASRSGRRYVVGGPPGAGGREVGIGLAAQLAQHHSTVLVDCNESSPGVARRLGLRLQPHILDAVELAAVDLELTPALAQPADTMPRRLPFDVIVGLPVPSEWQRLSRAGVDALLAACQGGWDHTVVVTSPIVEDLRRWVDRYGLSRDLIANAGTVVGVCEASPRGVLRFVDWLADCQPTVGGVDGGQQGAGLAVRRRRADRAAALVVW